MACLNVYKDEERRSLREVQTMVCDCTTYPMVVVVAVVVVVVVVAVVVVLVAEVVEEHHMLLGRELINVFGPEVLILWDVGVGEVMKAALKKQSDTPTCSTR